MPAHPHAQPPDGDPPPPSRRDRETPAAGHDGPPCDCGGCLEFRAIHAGFCAELPVAERAAKRATDRAAQRRWEEATLTGLTADRAWAA